MQSNLIKSLNKRYAVKKFDRSRKLSDQMVDEILEAARLTATSYGLQLMKVVLVKDQNLREKLVNCSFGQRQVLDASHLLVLCRLKELDLSHFENYVNKMATIRGVSLESLDGFKNMMVNSILTKSKDEQEVWMDKQVYIELGNLLTTCAVLGVDSCPMEGFISEEYDECLQLSEQNLKAVLVLPIGYRADDDKNASLKKVRRSSDDFIVVI